MTKPNHTMLNKLLGFPRTTALAGLCVSLLVFAPLSPSFAAGEGGNGGQHQGSQAGKGQGGKAGSSTSGHGQGQGGAKSVQDKVLSPSAEDSEEDSDRPAWAKGNREANPHAGSQGQPEGSGTKKGDLFGDLWVILRDNEGNPILDENGQVQPIIMVDGQLQVIHLVDDGDGNYELPAEYADLVQEVELGRTNVARSPEKVLDHSLTEAMSKLDGLTLDSSSTLTRDDSGRLVVDGTAIDSPLENLALYKAVIEATDTNGDGLLDIKVTYTGESGSGTYTFEVPTSDQLSLAASLLAAASDKTASLTVDRIVELNVILGTEDKLASLVSSYTYPGSTATYSNVSTFVNIQVAGQTTPDDPTDDVYKTVSYNLITGASVEYDGQTFTVPGVSFETVPNTVDENKDGILNIQDAGDLNGIDGFTQAVDDALQVLEFVHDNGVE